MESEARAPATARSGGKTKFLLGGALILAAVVYLIASSAHATAQYYMTVEEAAALGEEAPNRDLRISGAVDGETIEYDAESLRLEFTIVNVPADQKAIERAGGLARVLHEALQNPDAARMPVVYEGPRPDLLRHEAQAIVTGRMGDDGVFYAEELLLKCPTRYEEDVPLQSEA